MTRHMWTAEESKQLEGLLHLTNPEIGAIMGLHRDVIRRRRERLKHGDRYQYLKGRQCGTCSKPLTDKAKGGLCRSCLVRAMNADPECQRARKAGIAKKWQDPEHRAKMIRVAGASMAKFLAKPGARERLREQGRRTAREVLRRPDIMARARTPEVNAKRAKALHETRMGWCPPEHRQMYRDLTLAKRILAHDARRMVLEHIERSKPRLSPFERQERALRNGALLVANDRADKWKQAG